MDSARKIINAALTEHWLSNLLLDEDRDIYAQMTTDQKRVVHFALKYPGIEKYKELEAELGQSCPE